MHFKEHKLPKRSTVVLILAYGILSWLMNSNNHVNIDALSVTKAISICDLRDFQFPFVLRDILSNCWHLVSFGYETRVSRKHSQIEGLSKY